MAVLYLRITMSGLPGMLFTLSLYRYPCAHSHFRTSISGLVDLLRICDMQRWRCAGVRMSGMDNIVFTMIGDLSSMQVVV